MTLRARPLAPGIIVGLLAACSLFEPPYEEREVSGPTEVGNMTVLDFVKPERPRHRQFEVCLKLAPGYSPATQSWVITGPGGEAVRIQTVLEGSDGVRVPFNAPSFRLRTSEAFACFSEQGPSSRRQYTRLTLQSTTKVPVQAIVLADYDPK